MGLSDAHETEPDEGVVGYAEKLDALVDEASMGSFPASDPPSYWAREVMMSSAPAEGKKRRQGSRSS